MRLLSAALLPAFAAFLVGCSGAAEPSAASGVASLPLSSSRLIVSCVEANPVGSQPLQITLKVDGDLLVATEVGGVARGASLDLDYHPHGTAKVRYLIDDDTPPFATSEFAWNQLVIEEAVLAVAGNGQTTVRLDAGDRSAYRYVACSTK
jgi:hypothetical protein